MPSPHTGSDQSHLKITNSSANVDEHGRPKVHGSVVAKGDLAIVAVVAIVAIVAFGFIVWVSARP